MTSVWTRWQMFCRLMTGCKDRGSLISLNCLGHNIIGSDFIEFLMLTVIRRMQSYFIIPCLLITCLIELVFWLLARWHIFSFAVFLNLTRLHETLRDFISDLEISLSLMQPWQIPLVFRLLTHLLRQFWGRNLSEWPVGFLWTSIPSHGGFLWIRLIFLHIFSNAFFKVSELVIPKRILRIEICNCIFLSVLFLRFLGLGWRTRRLLYFLRFLHEFFKDGVFHHLVSIEQLFKVFNCPVRFVLLLLLRRRVSLLHMLAKGQTFRLDIRFEYTVHIILR